MLIRIAFERLNEACRWLAEQSLSPPKEKIEFAVKELLNTLEQNEDAARYHLLIVQATAALEAVPAEAKEIIEKENTFPYEVIARILAEGQQDGTIRDGDVKELALVLWTSINGLAIYKAVHGNKFRAPDTAILTCMFLRNNSLEG